MLKIQLSMQYSCSNVSFFNGDYYYDTKKPHFYKISTSYQFSDVRHLSHLKTLAQFFFWYGIDIFGVLPMFLDIKMGIEFVNEKKRGYNDTLIIIVYVGG